MTTPVPIDPARLAEVRAQQRAYVNYLDARDLDSGHVRRADLALLLDALDKAEELLHEAVRVNGRRLALLEKALAANEALAKNNEERLAALKKELNV